MNESKLFFENGEKKCCSQRLVCGRCPDRHPVKRDCNQDPICNRAFAAVKKCGVCVGGRTGRKPEDGTFCLFVCLIYKMLNRP